MRGAATARRTLTPHVGAVQLRRVEEARAGLYVAGMHHKPSALELRANAAPRLSREEERELVERAKAGDTHARDRLVDANLRYVMQIAHMAARWGSEREELIAAGAEGLVIAIGRFEPERGLRLVTYAVPWIRLGVLSVVKTTRSIVGRSAQGKVRSRVFFNLSRERGRLFTMGVTDRDEQITRLSAIFNVERGLLASVIDRLDARDASLDDVPRERGHDNSHTFLDLLADESVPSPEDANAAEEANDLAMRAIQRVVQRMPYRERAIVMARLLPDDEDDVPTLQEVGDRFGVSRERVRQIEAKAREKLRRAAVKADPSLLEHARGG